MRTSITALIASLFVSAAYAAPTELVVERTLCESKGDVRTCVTHSMPFAIDLANVQFPQNCLTEESRSGSDVRTQRTCIAPKLVENSSASRSNVMSSHAASLGMAKVSLSKELARSANGFSASSAASMSSSASTNPIMVINGVPVDRNVQESSR